MDPNRYRFVTARTTSDFERCFPIVQQLRPHLSFSEFVAIAEEAKKADDYEIVAVELNGQFVAVMGYRVLHDLVRGKYLYIDDLVTTEGVRSQGWGAKLLDYAEDKAIELGCSSLRLCAAVQNTRGIKFYESHGWTQSSIAYVKKTKSKALPQS